MSSPFQVAKEIGTNLSQGFRQVKDENAIDRILSESLASGDPVVLQNNIGKILSQVSPERQGPALQFLQGRYSQLQEQKQSQQKSRREREAGLVPGIAPAAQAAIYKESQKGKRLQEANQAFAQPGQAPGELSQLAPGQQKPSNTARKQQLLALTGHPDMEVRSRAKAELKNIQEEEKLAQTPFEPESEKLEAKRVAELATEVENEYKGAQNEELRLDRMAVLDKQGNVSAPALIKALDTFGLPIGVLSNPATEEFRKLETDFVRDVSKVFPGGRITNYEIQAYMRTIPSLMNSPEGRKEIIRNRKLLNEARKVRYDEYKKILKENNGKKPQNLSILLDERTQGRITDIENRFREGIEKSADKFQTPLRMYDPQGDAIDVPPKDVERALRAGARFG